MAKNVPLSLQQHRSNLRNKLDMQMRWFLSHGEWGQALRLIQFNNTPRGKNNKKRQRMMREVPTPNHYKQLLAMTSSSSSPPSQELLQHIREGCATDEIPNSPELYRQLVKSYCDSSFPGTAVEVAVEGNARWRFHEDLRQDLAVDILESCRDVGSSSASSAQLPPQQRHDLQQRIWHTALECVQHVLLASGSASSSSSSSVMIRRKLPREDEIRELLSLCAVRSGRGAFTVPKSEAGSTKTESVSNGVVSDNNQRGGHSSTTISRSWSACRAASASGNWIESLSEFHRAMDANAGFSSNTTERDGQQELDVGGGGGGRDELDRGAVHQLANLLGAHSNWQQSLLVASRVAESRRDVDPLLCNLVFAALPRPKCFFTTSEKAAGDAAASTTTAPASSASASFPSVATLAVRIFEQWMCELDSFSPPALTCALMVGYYCDIKDEQPGGSNEWLQNCVSLLSSFSLERNLKVRLDHAAHGAVQCAVAAVHKKLDQRIANSSNNSNSSEKENATALKEKLGTLTFPWPGYNQIAALRELGLYRAQRWASNRAAGGASRPNRVDYFPLAPKTALSTTTAATFNDEAERKATLEAARRAGADSVFASGTRGAAGLRVSGPTEQRTAFDDPRPAPVDNNDKASGYNYYGVGGKAVLPRGSRVASPWNNNGRRMVTLNQWDRSWKMSTPRAMNRKTSRVREKKAI